MHPVCPPVFYIAHPGSLLMLLGQKEKAFSFERVCLRYNFPIGNVSALHWYLGFMF
jgi:hypothetical protein